MCVSHCRNSVKMLHCFNFMLEPAKNFTAKIKVRCFGSLNRNITCLMYKPVLFPAVRFVGHCDASVNSWYNNIFVLPCHVTACISPLLALFNKKQPECAESCWWDGLRQRGWKGRVSFVSADSTGAAMCILIRLTDQLLSNLTLLLSKALVEQHFSPPNVFLSFIFAEKLNSF